MSTSVYGSPTGKGCSQVIEITTAFLAYEYWNQKCKGACIELCGVSELTSCAEMVYGGLLLRPGPSNSVLRIRSLKFCWGD